MKFITSFFKKVGSAFASLFTPAGQKKVLAALGQAEALVQEVLPVVEMIAAATPNKTDDEIVALVKKWCVPITIPAGPLTDADKGSLLLQTSITAATQTIAGATGVPTPVLTLALQAAYVVVKSVSTKAT
jgi:hypothetical protein